jgi:3-oxoacyl-[acyl-carrier-protein] synthase-3
MGTIIEAVAVATGDHLHTNARKLADRAIVEAVKQAGLEPHDIELLINAGLFHERNLGEPALAALIQEDVDFNAEDPHEGGHGTFSFDVANGTVGVLNALQIVDGFLAAGTIRHAVVVAGDADPGHRSAPGFPYDATAAAVVCGWHDGPKGLGGCQWLANAELRDERTAVLRFDGRHNRLSITEAPEFAVDAAAWAAKAAAEVLATHELLAEDIDVVVTAPNDDRFVDELSSRLGIDRDRFARPASSHRFHTASLLASLAAGTEGHPPPGREQRVLLVAAGSGITAGAALLTR